MSEAADLCKERKHTMKKKILTLAALLSVIAMSAGCVKIIDKGTEGQYTGKTVFSAEDTAEQLWEDITANITENAVELNTLLTEADGKFTSVAETYGVNGKANYPVHGTGVVELVDTSKSAGYLVVKLDGYEGEEEVRIQVGPTFKNKDMLGDSQTVTGFGDYTNQTEWGQVKDALIEKVTTEVIEPIDVNSLEGNTVEFTGAFGASVGSSDILIIPVELNVK